jgi:hypothetical protein
MPLRFPQAFCVVAGLTLAGAAAALPPAAAQGEPVASIPHADKIRDWSPLDNQRVIVNVNATDTYLLTLKQQCYGLRWAQNVTVSMSNNTIWAGFDAIRADGLQCPIDKISKVSPAELLELDPRD